MDNIKVNSRNQAIKATRQVKELEMLYKISRILADGTIRKKALADVLNALEHELGLNRGTITLLAPDGNEIRIEVAQSIPEKRSRTVRYRMGEGVTGKVMQSGKAMIVPKVSQEPLFLNRFERWNVTKEEISFICVPITIGRKVIGTISIDRIFDHERSLDGDKRVLSIVASMIANDVKSRQEAILRRRELEDENIRLQSGSCHIFYVPGRPGECLPWNRASAFPRTRLGLLLRLIFT